MPGEFLYGSISFADRIKIMFSITLMFRLLPYIVQLFLFASALSLLPFAFGAKPLNVVFFLIDDLGWNDVGASGSDYYQTPNIDQLAKGGMRFTNGYAACNVCSPTRAAIMTGKYPARLLLTQWLPSGRWDAKKNKKQEARYISNLPLEEFTIAEALREGGYKTAFMGKWHLGPLPYYFPEHQGFDLNVAGRDYGAPGSYWYPFEGSWKIPTTPGLKVFKDNPLSGKEGDYLPDRLAEEGDQFIRDNADSPFFLMMSHYAVHSPLQGKPDKVAKYEKIPKDQSQGDPRYAAMVESVDDSVGRILKAVRDIGAEDNTLVIFTSDNGGMWKATSNAPLRANKGSNYEGGLRVPVIIKWPGVAKPGSVSEVLVTSSDYYPTILAAADQPILPLQHLDGVDLTPVLKNQGQVDRDAIFWHYPHYNQHPESFPSGVIRKGDWKLIEKFDTGELELYDLATDEGEQDNLASKRPRLAQNLLSEMRAWRQEVGADPMRPNTLYEGNY
jgi:arylsulfatase A